MNLSELKAILEKEKINPINYDILQDDYLRGYDGFIINKADNGDFRLYYMERGQRDLLLQTSSEDQVCRALLREMGRSHKDLIKYVINIKILKEILKTEHIDPAAYDILQDDYLTGYDGFIINKADNGDFRLYYVERGQRDLLLQTDSEEQVCIALLREMGRGCKTLLKYIP